MSETAVPGDEVKATTCDMCACRCGVRVHLKQGEIRYIDGNPSHPLNRGVICAKGASGIMKQKSPARLTRPLRVGEPGAPLGFPAGPEDLFVDAEGGPVRIDKAFSWEYPLAAHGMMHNVIGNAWRGDPYRIDTLLIFMANMAWNSSMRPEEARRMLNDRDESGGYRIPFLVVCDAFASETVAYADLVLPDTTYLERHDVMSLLDRPISDFDGPMDSVRVPVVPPAGECRPFHDVLVWACPYGARELDAQEKVMKRCTLCVDRIHDELLPPQDRRPACVMACPTSARPFGDIHDPASEVATAIRERGGYALMPKWETGPANHYLPRRKNEFTG